MGQLVGQKCALCAREIESITEGGFCPTCNCPVHAACIQEVKKPGACAACGVSLDVGAEHHQRQRQEAAERAMDVRMNQGVRHIIMGLVWLLGGVGCSVFCFALAAAGGTGRFLIATGAIVAGVMQIFYGVTQLLRRPGFSPPDGLRARILLDPSLANNPELAAAWTVYGGVRLQWRSTKYRESNPSARRYHYSLAEEVESRTEMLRFWERTGGSDSCRDPYLDQLVEVNRGGFLREYVWTFLRDERWEADGTLHLSAFQAWQREHLLNHQAVTLASVALDP